MVKFKTTKKIVISFLIFLSCYATALGNDDAMRTYVIETVKHQGLKCDRALSLEKSAFESTPVETSWKLRCTNASYWVQIIPNVFTHIEKVVPEEDLSTVGKTWLK